MKPIVLLLLLLQTVIAQKLIDFKVSDLDHYYEHGKFHLKFKINQKQANTQAFKLSLHIITDKEPLEIILDINGSDTFNISHDRKILGLIFDKEQILPRVLNKKEQKVERNTTLNLLHPKIIKGIHVTLTHPTKAIKIPKNLQLKEIIETIKDTKVIFAGESHDKFSHHLNQLRIIQLLHQKGQKVAIGMEMFQRKFQTVIDDYLHDKISLKTFLKQSQYYQRWGFDYNLYRPIIDFAKQNHIPIIALNLERELTKKISKGGLGSLSQKEKAILPQTIDFSNQAYKDELLSFFNSHTHMSQSKMRNLEYIYQSQILWDQTMAHSINKHLNDHPDHHMVVLVGSGHLKMHYGIPSRIKHPYTIILQDEEAIPHSADYILYTQDIKTSKSLQLGVGLTKDKLYITQVVKNSLAHKLGLQKGDLLLSVDTEAIKTLEDLKVLLYFKKVGDRLQVTFEREGKKISRSLKIS
ncbi:MAG: ChaN family lipoprotein [Epsilonproteobacteria bacterium]|nr:ChaN family lipoprotein [Campylobacterota bacterium]